MRPLDQQTSQVLVAGSVNPKLWGSFTRLLLSWQEAQERSNISALGKTMGIFQGQNVSQSDQRPDAFDLLQQTSFRILRGGDVFDLSVILSDRLIDSLDLLPSVPTSLRQV